MSGLQFTFLLGIFALLVPTIKCDLLAVKCCARDKELSADLMTCQPLGATTEPKSVNTQSVTFSNTTFDVDNGFQNNTQDVDEDLNWLPQHLKAEVRADRSVVFGNRNKCTNSRTIRLKTPADEGRFSWLANGSLILRSLKAHGNFSENVYTPEDFCADTYTDNNGTQQHAILLCPCDQVRCLKKCCPPGQALVCGQWNKCGCKPYVTAWSPFRPDLPLPETDFSYEIVVDQNVTCGEEYIVYKNMFVGRPPYMIQRFWKRYWEEFNMCTDIIVGMLAEPGYGMMRCMRPPPFLQFLDNWLHVPEAVILGLAVVTLILAPHEKFSAYSHVNYLSLLEHAVCLLVRSLLWTVYIEVWDACYVTPIFVYFFSVGANLWLNVMCINMACGFWKPPARQAGRKINYKGMFLWYSLYAWGVTTAMTGFSAFMWYSLNAPRSFLRPTLFETRTCFIEEEGDGKMATFAYYYGPIAWLLFLNALLFVATAVKVRHLSKNRKMLKNEDSKATSGSFSNKWSVVIYIKVLWMMGVVEMAMEMVTWLSNDHIYYTVLAVTCLDVLRAIAIFVFCCCKRRTLRALRDNFCACAKASKSAAARAYSCCARLCACADVTQMCACVKVSKKWAGRMRALVVRLRQCCDERPKTEVDFPSMNGRYCQTVAAENMNTKM